MEVVVWPDAFLESHGVDVRSHYVERFWLSVLGPSATLLLRQLADRVEGEAGGVRLSLPTVARSLGLGWKTGHNAPFFRALQRCARFGMLRAGPGLLEVHCKIGPLPKHHLSRLPPELRSHHDECFEAARRSLSPTSVPEDGAPSHLGARGRPLPSCAPWRPVPSLSPAPRAGSAVPAR